MSRGERCSNCGGTEFVDAVDNDGQRYQGCAHCIVGPLGASATKTRPSVIALPRGDLFVAVHLEALEAALAHRGLGIVAVTPEAAERRRGGIPVPPGRFSLRKLVNAQQRIEQISADLSFVHPFTAEQLAIFSYALGILSTERLAAGERLDDPEVPA